MQKYMVCVDRNPRASVAKHQTHHRQTDSIRFDLILWPYITLQKLIGNSLGNSLIIIIIIIIILFIIILIIIILEKVDF